ncbi:hypothetical protein EJ04DRAFT_610345 [Polyplosphaeria fusca]|uniref:Uncharacterized protein n=1 Tax=Polyplosphaeria fusca TaxID=682080 RepID=A0A9P4QV79_9PLEO|nr:hypothetical protein EJ04DRAFT_610345 [Polyplosphaeria fusca]
MAASLVPGVRPLQLPVSGWLPTWILLTDRVRTIAAAHADARGKEHGGSIERLLWTAKADRCRRRRRRRRRRCRHSGAFPTLSECDYAQQCFFSVSAGRLQWGVCGGAVVCVERVESGCQGRSGHRADSSKPPSRLGSCPEGLGRRKALLATAVFQVRSMSPVCSSSSLRRRSLSPLSHCLCPSIRLRLPARLRRVLDSSPALNAPGAEKGNGSSLCTSHGGNNTVPGDDLLRAQSVCQTRKVVVLQPTHALPSAPAQVAPLGLAQHNLTTSTSCAPFSHRMCLRGGETICPPQLSRQTLARRHGPAPSLTRRCRRASPCKEPRCFSSDCRELCCELSLAFTPSPSTRLAGAFARNCRVGSGTLQTPLTGMVSRRRQLEA